MSFSEFVNEVSSIEIESEHLKTVQVSQAILECGRGKSDLFKQHKNPYGMKYRPEMKEIAVSVSYTDHAGETDQYCKFSSYRDAALAYWIFIDRSPYTGWRHASESATEFLRFITFAGYLGGPHENVPANQRASDRASKMAYIKKVKSLFKEADKFLGSSPVSGGSTKMWRGNGVFLDVGHGKKPGKFDPGAIYSGTKITEHGLNLIAAASCAKLLNSAGIPTRVDDGRKSNREAGRAARNYDVFISVHHNAASRNVQRSEVFYHSNRGTKNDKALAQMTSDAIGAKLGIKSRGAVAAAYTVLSGARSTNVRAAVLAELYFMHKQTPANPNPAEFERWSKEGGEALAEAILAWLKKHQ